MYIRHVNIQSISCVHTMPADSYCLASRRCRANTTARTNGHAAMLAASHRYLHLNQYLTRRRLRRQHHLRTRVACLLLHLNHSKLRLKQKEGFHLALSRWDLATLVPGLRHLYSLTEGDFMAS